MSNFIKKFLYKFSKNLSEIKERIFCAHYFSIILKKNKINNDNFENSLFFNNKINNEVNFNYLKIYKDYCFNVKHRVYIYIDKFGEAFFLGAGTHSLNIDGYDGFSFKDMGGRLLYPYFIKNIKLSDCIIIKNLDPQINLIEYKKYLYLLSEIKKTNIYTIKDYAMTSKNISIVANRLNLSNLPYTLNSYKKIKFANIFEKQNIVKNYELDRFRVESLSGGSFVEKKTAEILNVFKYIDISNINHYDEIVF